MNRLAYLVYCCDSCFTFSACDDFIKFSKSTFVWQETQKLLAVQVKSQTFICAVKILAVGSFVHVLSFAFRNFITII